MSHVPLVTREDLTDSGKERWDAEVERSGATPTHMKRALLNHLPTYDTLLQWYPLYAEVERIVGARGAVVYSFAISTENECLLCTTYFRRTLRQRGEDIDGRDLNDIEQDLADFGRSIARDHKSNPQLVARLVGRYGHEGVVALIGFGILMIGNNIVNSFLDVELDDGLDALVKELDAQVKAEAPDQDASLQLENTAVSQPKNTAASSPDSTVSSSDSTILPPDSTVSSSDSTVSSSTSTAAVLPPDSTVSTSSGVAENTLKPKHE